MAEKDKAMVSKTTSVGIDVGGTKTRLALLDGNLKVLEDIKVKTPKAKQEFGEELIKPVRKFLKRCKEEDLKISAVGVGFAGTIDHDKSAIKSAPNVPDLVGLSFKELLQDLCNCEVAALNDVHAALYGEIKVGKAAGCKDAIAIFIGTGIGGAVVINGKLHFGSSGEAGNIGHYLLHAFGPLAGSERHGILDDFVSRIAIAGAAATFAAKSWAPYLLKTVGTDVRKIKSSSFAEAIRAGDKTIEELVRSRVRIVGIVLSNMVDFLSPQMIVLGGGLTDAMPRIVRHEVRAGIRAHGSQPALRHVKVVTSKHKER